MAATKRNRAGNSDGTPMKKKRKGMKFAVKKQCMEILNHLMNHPVASIFNKPGIDSTNSDYSRVIKTPMDLGKVKRQLENGVYCEEGEFTVDVRLTIANAMRYNRPGTKLHIFARKVDELFVEMWESKVPILKKQGNDGSHGMHTTNSIDSSSSDKTIAQKQSSNLEDSEISKDISEICAIPVNFHRAHRVAALKQRYSSIILKAAQQMNEYKEQQEEWSRKLIEEQRAASKEALENMKQTVHFEESAEAWDEIQMLCREWSKEGERASSRFISLEALGLYLKLDDDEDLEEGEILCC